jgi:HAD superfamily 5'-nucleotidase-like hydrolase
MHRFLPARLLSSRSTSSGVVSPALFHKWNHFVSSRKSLLMPTESAVPPVVARRYDAPAKGEVFANSGLNLAKIDVWGFDYDYTIASWGRQTEHLIYNLGVKALLRKGYPSELASLEGKFDPSFVIRGLAYDKKTGFLLKLDQFGQIQLDSVYLGKRPLSLDEAISAYNGHTRLSRDYMSQNLHVLSDLFSIPEACLLADVTHFFETQGTHFYPYHLFQDIRQVIDQDIHKSRRLHELIVKDLPTHVDVDNQLGVFFERLRNGGKKVFLLSNSGFPFIDAGMTYLLSSFVQDRKLKSWRELFDIIIVDAKKPSWYSQSSKFRRVDTDTGALSISPVDKFSPGEVYSQGSLEEFHNLLGIMGDRVLYVGDQIYADLCKPLFSCNLRSHLPLFSDSSENGNVEDCCYNQ